MEAVAAAGLLHVANSQVGVAAQRLNALVENLASLLGVGVRRGIGRLLGESGQDERKEKEKIHLQIQYTKPEHWASAMAKLAADKKDYADEGKSKRAELPLGLHGRDARTYTEPGSLIDVKPWAPPRTYTGGGILISGQRRYARDMDEKDLRRALDVSITEAVRNGYGHVRVGSRHPPCGQGYAAIREIAEGVLR
jgi:hypothetical protein